MFFRFECIALVRFSNRRGETWPAASQDIGELPDLQQPGFSGFIVVVNNIHTAIQLRLPLHDSLHKAHFAGKFK